MSDHFDEEFAEIVDTVGPRRRRRILGAATQLAADIRADTELLGTAAVDQSNRDDLRVLGALPPQTFTQSRLWRHQLAEAATRLGEDTARWLAPVPRCTAEEMVLHLILRPAAVTDTGSPAHQAYAWPNSTNPRGWGDLLKFLFQDHDVLMLCDMAAQSARGSSRRRQPGPVTLVYRVQPPLPCPRPTRIPGPHANRH
jgi:hypothetical protein